MPECAMSMLEPLEARLMLSSAVDMVLIDGTLADADRLVRSVAAGGEVVLYDGARDTVADVLSRVSALAGSTGRSIASVSILSHGSAGQFALGNASFSAAMLPATARLWNDLGAVMADGGNIYLFACGLLDGSMLLAAGGHTEWKGRERLSKKHTVSPGCAQGVIGAPEGGAVPNCLPGKDLVAPDRRPAARRLTNLPSPVCSKCNREVLDREAPLTESGGTMPHQANMLAVLPDNNVKSLRTDRYIPVVAVVEKGPAPERRQAILEAGVDEVVHTDTDDETFQYRFHAVLRL